ncbi:hypothetical protein [Pseudomonas syringae group genomosp. 3]|nr:hypothetical protein [Pseudomonas syringae group genomosp. 3]
MPKKIIFVKKILTQIISLLFFVMRRAIPHFGSTNLRGTFMTSIRVLNTQEQSAVSAKTTFTASGGGGGGGVAAKA